jgi:hypothetical protein
MAALKGPLKKRLRPFLTTTHSNIRRESVFKKQELSCRSQDAGDSPNGVCNARDDTQGEGADDGISARVWQWDSLRGQTQKFDIQFRPAMLVAGSRHHSRIVFECSNAPERDSMSTAVSLVLVFISVSPF